MSVTTTADEKRRKAREHISEAYKCILEVLDEDTWGHDEYSAEYIDKLGEIAMQLLKIKREV